MKRVGILSLYYNNSNYGGQLQAYALTRVVSNMGCDAKQISYIIESGYEKKRKNYILNRVIRKYVKYFFGGFYRKNQIVRDKIKLFEKTIPHTEPVTFFDIGKMNDLFDMFICGSDQIWNPIGWQETLFLDFSTKTRISYAASIAIDNLNDEEFQFLEEKTKNFQKLSLREKNSVDVLNNKLSERYFELVPDPTLLLSKDEWNERFPPKKEKNRPYIFAYFLGFNEQQREECKIFASELGLDIFFLPYLQRESYIWEKRNKTLLVQDYTVESFIDLIRNAELVLTDSYHGTIFSCIYNIPFYVLSRCLVENQKSMNSRIETLFYELNIKRKRFTDGLCDIQEYKWKKEELEIINENLKKWRVIGLKYLADAVVRF